MNIVHADSTNFEEKVLNNEKTVILDFYADWCGPCRMLGPVLENVANEREDLTIVKVNVDDNPDLASAYDVTSIPALFVIKNGKTVNQAIGFMPKESILELV